MKFAHGGDIAGFAEQYGAEPLDFSANISPLGIPSGALKAAEDALRESDRYPDPMCRKLRAELAEYHKVSADRIVCGTGAAELIHRLGTAVRPGKALIPFPAFSEYERALAPWNCEIHRYPLKAENNFRIGRDFTDHIKPETDLVILCEPGNPAGVTTDPQLLQEILGYCRKTDTLLAADECFLPFLDEPEQHSLIPYLGEGNLLIFRAFTKFYGMAGLRLGYCITDEPGLAVKLSACGQPWPVSSPAQAAGGAALKDREYAERLRKLIHDQRAEMYDRLVRLGMRVIPGEANFLLFYSRNPDLSRELEGEGILIRSFKKEEGLGPGWFRTAIRTPAENERLLQAIGRYV